MSPKEDQMERETSQSGSDIDAEGSEDVDYIENPSAPNAQDMIIDAPTPSSTSSTGQSNKRKHEEDDADYIRHNPELFGLRRSVSGC
jgi:hypothetical protein